MKNIYPVIFLVFFLETACGQCDSAYTHYGELPSNVTILVGDSCLYNDDINVLDSLININGLDYNSPLELGTQTWFNGRLRFLVAGNYGNSSGVNNTIYTLPENIGNWSSVTALYLEWNGISELPNSFSKMSELRSFYINNNVLTSLGDSIGNLANLYIFDLGYNELASIPESICNLEGLSYLWLFNNNLESLPDCFCGMGLDWDNYDTGGYPYFAIGANALCDSVPTCVSESVNFELSLEQSYYSFHVFAPQNCGNATLEKEQFPYQFSVSAPFPNPFNPETKVKLYIPYDRRMNICVYDILGNEIDVVSNEKIYSQGVHTISWNGKESASGVYFLRFFDGKNIHIRKLILVK